MTVKAVLTCPRCGIANAVNTLTCWKCKGHIG